MVLFALRDAQMRLYLESSAAKILRLLSGSMGVSAGVVAAGVVSAGVVYLL